MKPQEAVDIAREMNKSNIDHNVFFYATYVGHGDVYDDNDWAVATRLKKNLPNFAVFKDGKVSRIFPKHMYKGLDS